MSARYRCDQCAAEWRGNDFGRCPECGVGIDIGNVVPRYPPASDAEQAAAALRDSLSPMAHRNRLRGT